jgi:hypothetical protein
MEIALEKATSGRRLPRGAVKNAKLVAEIGNIVTARAQLVDKPMRGCTTLLKRLMQSWFGLEAGHHLFQLRLGLAQQGRNDLVWRYQRPVT